MLATLSVLDTLEDGAGEMLVRLSDGEAPAQAAPKGEVDGLGAKAEQRPEDADAADPDEASADLQSEPEPDA